MHFIRISVPPLGEEVHRELVSFGILGKFAPSAFSTQFTREIQVGDLDSSRTRLSPAKAETNLLVGI
jgi:hypothetical protein